MRYNSLVLVIALVAITLGALAAATALTVLHDDASKAWEAMAAALGALVGLHVPSPLLTGNTTTSTVSPNSGTGGNAT